MSIGVCIDRTYCCGINEIGKFRDPNEDDDGYSEYEAEDAAELLDRIKSDYPEGLLFHIWFVKHKKFDETFEEDYEYDDLRQLVQQIPGVIHIAETINPNSKNMIDGYAWVNTKDKA